jgi:hypothetical protein
MHVQSMEVWNYLWLHQLVSPCNLNLYIWSCVSTACCWWSWWCCCWWWPCAAYQH